MKKYTWVFALFFLLWSHTAFANTCTWVSGSTANWSSAASWTLCGGVAPTAADDVVVAGTGTLTIDGTSGAPNLGRSANFTGFTGTLTHATTKQLNLGDGTTGNLTLVAGMTYTPSTTSLIKFVSTTTGNQIFFGGKSTGTITFDGVGGAWQLQDAPGTSNPNATWTLINGALDTNGKNISAIFSSSNSNTRSLTLGATNWTIGSSNGTAWDISTSTGMTLSAASSTLTWTPTVGTLPLFAGGGLTYGTLTSTTNQTATMSVTGANTFGTLTLSMGSGAPTTTTGFKLFADQTVTGTFTSAGNSLIDRSFLYSDTLGTARTISAATFAITNADLRDITKAGAGSGDLSATSSSTGNGDCGGNTGWTFQAPRSVYMKTAVSVNWSANNWKTTSGGVTAAVPPIPLCHDTSAVFDANSVTAGSKVITLDMPRVPSFTWSGVLNTPAFATGSATFEAYGSVILVSGMTHTGTGPLTLSGRGSYSLDGGTLTWPTSSTLQLNVPTGTYTLARAFTSNDGLTTTTGTFANGGFASTVTAITINGGTVSGSGAITGTTYNQTSGTVGTTSTITGTTYTQSGGTNTLGGTLTLTGALAVSGGTLNMNSNTITGHTTATISSTGTLNLSGQLNGSGAFSQTGGTITDSGASGEIKGTTVAFSGGTTALRKMTASSTFQISSTANVTFNPGTSTWVTSFTETGTTHSLTYNGTATNINGTLTVSAPPTTGYAWSQ